MLHYKEHDGSTSYSRFFIYTKTGSIYYLSFEKKEEEELSFDDSFLQENVFEMTIVKYSRNNESGSLELVETIKHIFDDILYQKDNAVIYISVDYGSLRHRLIQNIVDKDINPNFHYACFHVGESMFYFFLNENKTSTINVLNSLLIYFKKEYDINFVVKPH